MEALIEAFFSLEPFWLLMTILGGLVVGFVTKNIRIDKKTIYLLLTFYLPFVFARIVILALFGVTFSSGSGYVGSILFLFYLIGIILGRKGGNFLGRG